MSADLAKLQQRLAYTFRDADLLEEAVTHRSAQGRNNERLEFLGDSVLNCVIAAALFELRPEAPEGSLSRLRASLVNRPSLAELARELELGGYLRLGCGELKTGGHRRDSILSDTLEAIFGAVYMDSGFETCRQLILSLYRQRLQTLPAHSELKDPKTRLQEFLQAGRRALPTYTVLEVSGKAHDQVFRVECRIEDIEKATQGVAASRRQAEQQAAESMLAGLSGNLDGGI